MIQAKKTFSSGPRPLWPGMLCRIFIALAAGAVLYLQGNLTQAVLVLCEYLFIFALVFACRKNIRDRMNLQRRPFRDMLANARQYGLDRRLPFRPVGLCVFAGVGICVAALCARWLLSGGTEFPLTALCGLVMPLGVTGWELAMLMPLMNGRKALSQRSIFTASPEKLVTAAETSLVLADKTAFTGVQGSVIDGVYCGGRYGSPGDFTFEELFPLLTAVYACDGEGIAQAFGFRGSITDGVFRSIRTTALEHRELFQVHVSHRRDYDGQSRTAGGTLEGALLGMNEGSVRCCMGSADCLLPAVGWYLSEGKSLPSTESTQRYWQNQLLTAYQQGRNAVVVTAENASGVGLLGILYLSSDVDPVCVDAVETLRKNGIKTVYVTDENENSALLRAKALGIASEPGEVLTGGRLERFKPENLERALSGVRVGAELDNGYRRLLSDLLKKERCVCAVAADNADGLAQNADVCIVPLSAEADGSAGQVFEAKSRALPEVLYLIQTARRMCAACKKAAYQLLLPSLGFGAAALITAAFQQEVTFSPACVLFLTVLLPLCRSIALASADVRPVQGKPFGVVAGQRIRIGFPHKQGRLFALWHYIGFVGAGIYAAIFVLLKGAESFAPEQTFTFIFWTLGFFTLAVGLTDYVWGNSLMSLNNSRKGVVFLLFALLWLVPVTAMCCLSPLSAAVGMSALSPRVLPYGALPGICAAVLYEGGVVLGRKFKK